MNRQDAAAIVATIADRWNTRFHDQTGWLDAVTELDETIAWEAVDRYRPVAGERPSLPSFRAEYRRALERREQQTRPSRPTRLDDHTIELGRANIARFREQRAERTTPK